MALQSMKKPASMKSEEAGIDYAESEYPHGLEIYVNDEHVSMLGLDACNVGDEVMVYAKAKITHKGQSERETEEGTDEDKNVNLQITDMQVVKETQKTSDTLYGK